jgi:polysaccharide chain length determinant protein (PEP-CTERM system associated)
MAANKGLSTLVDVSWRSVLRAAWKQKLLIVTTWLALAAAGVAVVYKWPATYAAEALILVDSQKIPDKFVASTVSTDLQDRIATISQQILSSTRLKKIIEQFNLYHEERKTLFEEDILEMMRKDYSISFVKGWVGNKPGAFRIGFRGTTPATVSQVANELASLYVSDNLKTREVQAEGTSDFLDNQLQEAKKQLDQLEATVTAYKIAHNGELPQQENALSGALSRLQVQLEANRDAINRAQDSKVMLESTLRALEANVVLLQSPVDPAFGSGEPARNRDRGSTPSQKPSDVLQAQIDLLRVHYTADYPLLKRLEARLLQVKAREQESELGALPLVSGDKHAPASASEPAGLLQLKERLSDTRAKIVQAEKELDYRQQEQQRISREMASTQTRMEKLPLREQEMAQITRDYEISKANYRSLLDKKTAAEMSTDMERRQKSERFTIVDPARVPEKPISPNRPLLYTLASLLSLVVGLAAGFGREYRHGVLLGEWELPGDLTVLGHLPVIHITGPSADSAGRPGDSRMGIRDGKWRWVVLGSGLLLLVAMIAVGAYLVSNRS